MKMIKAIKKLKFWHREKKKKKKKKQQQQQQPHLPPLTPPHCCCSCPSAPPLPPWYAAEQAYDDAPPDFIYSTQQQQEIVSEVLLPSHPSCPTLLRNSTTSYQQYMAPNPVYAVPAMPAPPSVKKSAGIFGCAVEFGRFLFRCFCPCFQF